MTELLPWGRFKLVSKDQATEEDHIYFYMTTTIIGRDPARVDIALKPPVISSVHCSVKLTGTDEHGKPTAILTDLSRNGIWADQDLIGKSNSVPLTPNLDIHFTRPGVKKKKSESIFFKFEFLETGLTPENERLRAERDRAAARPRDQTSAPSTPGGSATRVTGKKQKITQEEIVVEETTHLWTSGESSPAKRRRTGDAPTLSQESSVMQTAKTFQESNQALRQQLKEANEYRMQLKQTISIYERDQVELKEKLGLIEVERRALKEEVDRKNVLLANQEAQMKRAEEDKNALLDQVKSLQLELAEVKAGAAKQTETIAKLKSEREKTESEMVSMTKQLDAHQTKNHELQEQVRKLRDEKQELKNTIDYSSTTNADVEEDQRGILEDNTLLKTRLRRMTKAWVQLGEFFDTKRRALEDETSVIDDMLVDLRNPQEKLISSWEQSEPSPAAIQYCPDTQPEDGTEDLETLDQGNEASRVLMVTRANAALGVFPPRTHKSIPTFSVSSAELNDSDQQTQSSSDHQTLSSDLSENSPMLSRIRPPFSSRIESITMAMPSLTSSTAAVSTVTTAQSVAETQDPEETKDGEEETEEAGGGEQPPVQEEEEEEEAAEVQEEGEEAAEGEDDEAAEAADDNKENTPVKEAAASTKPKTGDSQQPGQPGWLQRINFDGPSESHASASEGAGVFDDETQLSPDE
ncbi:hypothetical protein Poli38472_005391 [Pythium oligandrum]|uniref:FHA domain-containing protein n=1 Tax=Pythium oligandrum TaxID=41045 RepID=A0A8K1FLK3_PYTOL|nr:hypothetical protein Poli38472_005391 [Pythium oligandrum]|eukprot:TMW62773.1 hypothetical protein Poli38472_005391 [Pythium oligandrum]